MSFSNSCFDTSPKNTSSMGHEWTELTGLICLYGLSWGIDQARARLKEASIPAQMDWQIVAMGKKRKRSVYSNVKIAVMVGDNELSLFKKNMERDQCNIDKKTELIVSNLNCEKRLGEDCQKCFHVVLTLHHSFSSQHLQRCCTHCPWGKDHFGPLRRISVASIRHVTPSNDSWDL